MKFARTPYLLVLAMLAAACGAGAPSQTAKTTDVNSDDEPMERERLTASDFYRTELVNGEFTDEVDETRYKAIGEVLEEISPRQRVIYFVGKLQRVPTQARIRVHWYHDSVAEPMLVSDVYGSDTFSFISDFKPSGARFLPGNYTVKVLVNDQIVGSRAFVIKGVDPFRAGLQVVDLKIAKKINNRTMAAVKPDTQFAAASKLYASFRVKNCMSPADLTVHWYRAGALFSDSEISVNGNGQFSANVESPSGLPQGVYSVEVEHEDQVVAESKFTVGNASLGPSIDTVELGTALGRDSMPSQETTRFKKGTEAVYLGLRFLDLEPSSEILVEWVMVDGSEQSTYHTTTTPVPGGGSGTMSAQWSPGEIYPGNYKAVVYINQELAVEKEFAVQ